MRFIETPIITRQIVEPLNDDGYAAMQIAMIFRPHFGRVIRHSGGLRVIYYWHEATETFYMLYAYGKSEREDPTVQQLRVLSRLVREEFE